MMREVERSFVPLGMAWYSWTTLPMHFKTNKAGSTTADVDQFTKGKQHVRAFPYSEIEVSKDNLSNNAEIILLQHEK